jgi:hypothetical protein
MDGYDSDNKQEFLCNSWSGMRLTLAGTPAPIGPIIPAPEADDDDDDDDDDHDEDDDDRRV